MKTILFLDQNMNERGTSSAIYDYAHYNETILGNRSIIATKTTAELITYDKFKNRFQDIFFIKDLEELNFLAKDKECDFFYNLKYGHNDGVLLNDIKNLVHVVFPSYDPHGDIYAYVSQWLAEEHGKESPFVPHMIDLPRTEENLRNALKIDNKFVFGWYGGRNFCIPFAREAVIDCARNREDVFFLFMNEQPFCEAENVLFLPRITDPIEKVKFINTCDVMLHANDRGETFGIAVGEFSSKNKPVVTYSLKNTKWEKPGKSHLNILGKKAILYDDYNSLMEILMYLKVENIKDKEWNCYQEFSPEKIMHTFKKVFLS